MDAMARTFTAGNDSSMSELLRTGGFGVPADRARFGPANNPNGGFRQQYRDDSNQVRHFTGGLIAGYRLGFHAGFAGMATNEIGNSHDESSADHRLNLASTNLGATLIRPYETSPMSMKHGIPYSKTDYRNLAAAIRSRICNR